MLGLHKSTEVKKQIPKKLIFNRFASELKGDKKVRLDSEISRIVIQHEISPVSINIQEGRKVKSIFIVEVYLKTKEYFEGNIVLLSKLVEQNILMVLRYEGEVQLAIYQTRLLTSEWKDEKSITLNITGLNLDLIWEDIIGQVSGIYSSNENTIDEQILIEEKKMQTQKKIEELEKQARKETQSKKKFDLFQRMKEYQKQLEEL